MMKWIKILGAALIASTAVAASRNIPLDTAQYSTQGSAPSSPGSGTVFSYFLSSDGAPYWKNSSGTAFGHVYSSSVFANHGIIIGTGASRALGYVGPCADSEALFGVTSSDPVCRAIALTDLPSQSQATFLGRTSGAGSGTPTALSATQANVITGSEDLALAKAFSIAESTDTSTGNIDALTSANISAIRLTGAAPVLRGIVAPSVSQWLVISNAAGTSISVKNQDSNPTAANRIITGTGADLTLADTASILLKYDLTTARWRIIGGSGSGGGSGDSMNMAVSQTSHGFSVGDAVYYTGSVWAKAQANSAATSEALGIVTAVPTANTFTLTMGGNTGAVLSGLTAGQVYYVSDVTAGNTTTVEPSTINYVSKPIMVAYASDSAVVVNMRGQVVAASGSAFAQAGIYAGHFVVSSSNYWTASTNGSYGNWTATGTPNLTQDYLYGFSSVSAAASTLPGVTFTAPATGTIEVFMAAAGNAGGATIGNYQIYESGGSTVIGYLANNAYMTAGLTWTGAGSGYLNVTAGSSYTVILREKQSGGGVAYIGNSGTQDNGLSIALKYVK